jgi:microcystin-dependent protein
MYMYMCFFITLTCADQSMKSLLIHTTTLSQQYQGDTMEQYLGTISIFGFPFTPADWAPCHGQSLSQSQYVALFSIIGNTYGPAAQGTFLLPDLRGRMPMGEGTAPGLIPRFCGNNGGKESIALSAVNMPSHTHTAIFCPKGGSSVGTPAAVNVLSSIPAGATTAPSAKNNILCASPTIGNGEAAIWAPSTSTPDVALGGVSGGGGSGITGGTVINEPTGNNSPFNIVNPFLVLNFCIAMTGIFPMHA